MQKNNIFKIPMIICLILCGYVIVSLINSGYFYEKSILVSVYIILSVWIVFFFSVELKNKKVFNISKKDYLSFFGAIFLGFYYAFHIWFNDYLNLDPMSCFLSGNSNIDNLFHSDIAESFITNGYPSIMFNGCNLLHYHVISHFFISLISRIIRVPCIVTYNYLYPVIFIPIYVLLLQTTVIVFRKRNSECKSTVIYDNKDFFFLLCICLGFNFFGFCDKACFWYNSMIDSESNLIAIILMLITFSLFFYLPSKFRDFIDFLLIPISIFLISGTKISCGVIFILAIEYYHIMLNPKSKKNFVILFMYFSIFTVSYIVFGNKPVINTAKGGVPFYLFHFARTYIQSKYWIIHYAIYLLPSVLIYRYYVSEKLFSKEYLLNRSNIWPEMAFLLTIFSWLPGFFLEIAGGSAEYFVLPAFIINILLFQGLCIHKKIYNSIKEYDYKNIIIMLLFYIIILKSGKQETVIEILEIILVIILLGMIFFGKTIETVIRYFKKTISLKWVIIFFICYSLFIPEFSKLKLKDNIYQTIVISNKESLKLCTGKKEAFKQVFGKSDLLSDVRYKSIKEIREMTEKDRSKYCLFIAEDCYLYDLYGERDNPPHYVMKCDYAAAAWFGIPVINAIYREGNDRYRGDGKLENKSGFREYYGLGGVTADRKVSLQNLKEVVNSYGKKGIIILTNDSYMIEEIE